MFDSPLCDRPFTQFPLASNWGQLDWLKLPLILGLLLLAIFGIRSILKNSGWKRRFSRPKSILLLSGLTATLLILLAVADKGLVLFLPTDSGATADSIVVLGRGTEFGKPRIEVVTQLWQAKRAPVIFASGSYDASRMLQRFQEKGIPKSALDGEDCSLTTPENALFTAAILKPRGIQRILLVTDGPHMWRSLLDLRDQGFTVIPHVSPLPNSMAFMDKAFLTFREYLFLITSSLHQLFQGQRMPNVNNPELQNLVQLAQQYGKQQL